MGNWIQLSTHYELATFRSGLTVVVNALSALALFAYAKFCHAMNTIKIAKKRTAALVTLLTLGSWDDVLDIVKLFQFRILQRRHLRMTIRSLVVLFFSATGLVAGPIAKYATRGGRTISQVKVDGLLANGKFSCISVSALIPWNITEASLNQANFPTDQLLDFLPDTSRHWVYKPDEWNSTYLMNCEMTPLTTIPNLSVESNYTTNTTFFQQIPGLLDIVPASLRISDLDGAVSHDENTVSTNGASYYSDQELFILYSRWPYPGEILMEEMSFTLIAVHFHMIPRDPITDNWRIGPIQQTTFTRAFCNITQVRDTGGTYVAHLVNDIDSSGCFIQALGEYTSYNWLAEGLPSPDALIRFYQTYIIVKDTWVPNPVTRLLSVQLSTVEMSAIFLAALIILAVLIVLALITSCYISERPKTRKIAASIPESKLDWILHAIKEAYHTESRKTTTTIDDPLLPGARLIADPEKKIRRIDLDATMLSCEDHLPPPGANVSVDSSHT